MITIQSATVVKQKRFAVASAATLDQCKKISAVLPCFPLSSAYAAIVYMSNMKYSPDRGYISHIVNILQRRKHTHPSRDSIHHDSTKDANSEKPINSASSRSGSSIRKWVFIKSSLVIDRVRVRVKSRVYAVVQTALPEKCLLRENLIPSFGICPKSA